MGKKIYFIYQIPKFIEGYDFIEERACLYPEYMELYTVLDNYEEAREFIKNNTTGLDEHYSYFIALVTNEIGDICQTNSTFELFEYETKSNQYFKIEDSNYTILKNRDITPSDSIYLPKEEIKYVFYKDESYIIFPEFIKALIVLKESMLLNIRTKNMARLINKCKCSLYTILKSELSKEEIDSALNDYMNNIENENINKLLKIKF